MFSDFFRKNVVLDMWAKMKEFSSWIIGSDRRKNTCTGALILEHKVESKTLDYMKRTNYTEF